MPDRVFVDTTYGYRNWRTAVIVLPFGGAGGWIAYRLVYELIVKPPDKASEWAMAVLVTVICAVFLSIAGYMLRGAITGRRDVARIDTDGITIGSYFLPWERVRFIAGARSGRGFLLHIGVKRRPDRMFWIGRSWTKAEYDALRDELDPFLEQAYPDIGLGA